MFHFLVTDAQLPSSRTAPRSTGPAGHRFWPSSQVSLVPMAHLQEARRSSVRPPRDTLSSPCEQQHLACPVSFRAQGARMKTLGRRGRSCVRTARELLAIAVLAIQIQPFRQTDLVLLRLPAHLREAARSVVERRLSELRSHYQ